MKTISVFDLFSIGIGPSSSHTVGPMRAAYDFIQHLVETNQLSKVARIQVELYGSLALTGFGHGTPTAIFGGLEGERPEIVDPSLLQTRKNFILSENSINLLKCHPIPFHYDEDLLMHANERLERHTNGMHFTVFDKSKKIIYDDYYYSIGGGFIVREEDFDDAQEQDVALPYPFRSADNLLAICSDRDLSIAEVTMANENMLRPEMETREGLLHIAKVMSESIHRGSHSKEKILPGVLKVTRRSPDLFRKLQKRGKPKSHRETTSLAWLNLYALAVAEENAAGGRVVTAPTNAAAGVFPAVLQYYFDFSENVTEQKIIDFLLTASAIGLLYKKGASIAGAEVGCQGEIGVASSMAAGAFTAAMGGTSAEIENAAEIAMEHHLGMTCDPVAGLVQIPCIERNAMGAIKALNASFLARIGEGKHFISLDRVIAVMLQTGKDMDSKYKETSLGGLAQSTVGC